MAIQANDGAGDEVTMKRIAELLRMRIRARDADILAARRVELGRLFEALSSGMAASLLERLSDPDPQDPLTELFMRLATPTRQELLARLARRSSVPEHKQSLAGALPSAVSSRLLRREVQAEFERLRRLSPEAQIFAARETVKLVRQLVADPRFASVDRQILKELSAHAAIVEQRIWDIQQARANNTGERTEETVNYAVALAWAMADGPEPALADLAALALLALGVFTTTAIVTYKLNPDLEDDQAEAWLRDNEAVMRRIEEVLQKRPTPAPAPRRPDLQKTTDPLPQMPEPKRRPACSREWVDRPYGSRHQKVHNEFCEFAVHELRINAPAGSDYRVKKGGRFSTNYDSYDSELVTFFEFKTRHEYLENDFNDYKWWRSSGIMAQAADQRETLLKCGFHGELHWVFDNLEAVRGARAFLSEYVDKVYALRWR